MGLKLAPVLTVLLTGFGILGLSMAPYHVYAQPSEPVVAQEWVSALDSGDTGAALALLADDAVVIVDTAQAGGATEIYTGKDEIGATLRAYAADNYHTQLLGTVEVVNGTTSWVERQSSDTLRSMGLASQDVKADALIEAGKIKSLIYEPVSAQEGGEATPRPSLWQPKPP